MNEVSNTSASLVLVPAASSKGGVEAQAEASGKKLPQLKASADEQEEKSPATAQSKVNVEQALASVNEFVQSVQRDLQFSVDEELNTTVVKVIDSKSGELIRQIPEESFLELARKLNNGDSLQLIDALG